MIPEVAALYRTGSIIRIPPADDVPMTPRVQRIVDSAPMRRLATISQLGMIGLVYPGATHSRLEHSLGVYHNALRLLARFDNDSAFTSHVDSRMADAFVLAALIHDVGHWPFCHPIEDIKLSGLSEHESQVASWLKDEELSRAVEEDWACDASDVLSLIEPADGLGENSGNADAVKLLRSCLSGPIDVDKLDYLQRDSLHAGVPYGRNFDIGRLISSMCVHPNGTQIAVGEKGRTAAEMMVFSRYVMFSEVYWHHAVRSATAMLQRAVFHLHDRIDWESSLRLDDAAWVDRLKCHAEGSDAAPLVIGLFGEKRRLFKRAAEFSVIDDDGECGKLHRMLARRPYWWLVALSDRLSEIIESRFGIQIRASEILIDAPPVELEVDINIDVIGRDGTIRTLGEVSPVASALADRQFDDQVKRVRVFVAAKHRDSLAAVLQNQPAWAETLREAVSAIEKETA